MEIDVGVSALAWVLALLPLAAGTPAIHAQTLTVLYNFTEGVDGGGPSGPLLMDKSSNLYGTTENGGDLTCGSFGCGTVFKLDPSGNETVLHSFVGLPNDGALPAVAGLVMDKSGNLYGTTSEGGASNYGTIFKIDSSGNEAVLYSFAGPPGDGAGPVGGLVMDKSGNLYGTTNLGGNNNFGTVFRLDSLGNETVLYSFAGPPSDGRYPLGGFLLLDKTARVIYGTTQMGGSSDDGTVFRLDATNNETVLHNFIFTDGAQPYLGLILSKTGILYGTTNTGGSTTNGTIFVLDSFGNEAALYTFAGPPADGELPNGDLITDKTGNFYGTTQAVVNGFGGYDTEGVVFKVDASGSETVLHSFNGADGLDPLGGLLMDKAGNLYGTTFSGGSAGFGTVFKLVP